MLEIEYTFAAYLTQVEAALAVLKTVKTPNPTVQGVLVLLQGLVDQGYGLLLPFDEDPDASKTQSTAKVTE